MNFLVGHGRNGDALKVAELSRSRTLLEGLAPREALGHLSAVGLQPEQIARKAKQTLLFYWIGRNRSHLWVISQGKTSHFELAKAAEIVPLTKSYRKGMRSLRDAQDSGSAEGRRLYALLVEPARALRSRQLILVPDPVCLRLTLKHWWCRAGAPFLD